MMSDEVESDLLSRDTNHGTFVLRKAVEELSMPDVHAPLAIKGQSKRC